MNNIQIFKNKELNINVRTMKNEDGSISIDAEDTAIGFGWYQVKNNKKYPKWERVNSFISEIENSPLVGKGDYIPESLFYLLGMKANNEVARKFQTWLAVEVIPQIRKTGSYQSEQKVIEGLTNMVEGLQKTIEKNEETIEEFKSMCKITCSKKHDYTSYIKKRLGVNKVNSEYEQVKARVFFILNISKWEDIDLETSKNILNIIDESITIIKRERPYKQMSYFD